MHKPLKSLTHEELLTHIQFWVGEERKAQMELLECLAEVQRRSLHKDLGFSSLWDFATRYLGLSEGAAQRRIDAMKLSEIPEAKSALESGMLSLSNAVQLQSFFRAEKKQGIERTVEERLELVKEILAPKLDSESSKVSSGISQKELQRRLAETAPEVVLHSEKARVISKDKTELKVVLDSAVVEMLDELRNLMAHQLPQATYGELIAVLADEGLKRIRKKRTGQREPSPTEPQSAAATAVAPEPKSTAATAAAPILHQRSGFRPPESEAVSPSKPGKLAGTGRIRDASLCRPRANVARAGMA